MDTEPLGKIQVEELLEALYSGEIVEEYPEDTPYPSCLILGHTRAGRVLHVVAAPVPNSESLIIITTYQPDPDRWESDFKRRSG